MASPGPSWNESALARLRLGRDRTDEEILVTHGFNFEFGATYDARRAFTHALREAGFGRGEGGDVSWDTEGRNDDYCHAWAFTRVTASREALLELDSLARSLARRHRTLYNGWAPSELHALAADVPPPDD